MEEKLEIMNLLQNKQLLENELKSLAYGSVEIRENESNKYIYVHYREDGVALTKYVGEYSNELYNLVLNNSIKAKELKKPSGGKPGMVIYHTNKTLVVDPHKFEKVFEGQI